MTELAEKTCRPCKSGAPSASPEESTEFLTQLPDWQVIKVDGIKRLTRAFDFKDFAAALAFSNRVGEIAERQNHHPAILTEWGRVEVTWWTHRIGGLHLNDFIMAAKTDQLV